MQRNTLGLLVAAAAAYGAYRYNKMTSQQKNDLKAKGKSFVEKNFNGLNGLFGKKTSPVNGSNQ